MSVSTVAGDSEPEYRKYLRLFFTKNKTTSKNQPEIKRLSENVIESLITRGCNVLQLKKLLDIAHEYKAEWTAEQHIVWHHEFGWQEMLQYRPGIIAAVVLKAQKLAQKPLSPSFQQAASYALGWPVEKVLGFQMGISGQFYTNPSGVTNDEYLNGLALGYLFHQSLQYNKRGKQ